VDLVTVGRGTVAPPPPRTSACHWVARGNLKILLDCGAGALHRLAQFGLPWHQVTHVVLSHFHPDHWGELPMLVYALKYTTVPPRQESLVILGPRGVVRLVKQLAEGYGSWLLDPGFPIGILDVQNGEPFPLDAEVSLETFRCRIPPRAWRCRSPRPRGGWSIRVIPGPRASWPGGPPGPTCCSRSARSPRRWPWTSISPRSRRASWPGTPRRGSPSWRPSIPPVKLRAPRGR